MLCLSMRSRTEKYLNVDVLGASLFFFLPDEFSIWTGVDGEDCAWGNDWKDESVDGASDFFHPETLIVELFFEDLVICFFCKWVECKLN